MEVPETTHESLEITNDTTSEQIEITEEIEVNTNNINPENIPEEVVEITEDVSENAEVSNCLALTIRKDYSISVIRNVFVRTAKGILKVAISIFTLNFFKFFF